MSCVVRVMNHPRMAEGTARTGNVKDPYSRLGVINLCYMEILMIV